MSSRVTWSPIGTTIVGWRWLAVPDKYAGPRAYDDYDDALAYATKTLGRVEIEYDLRSPEGALWTQPMMLPGDHQGAAAVGSIVVGRTYRPGQAHDDVPDFATPEEAEAYKQSHGGWIIAERLRLRTPDGAEFEAGAAFQH